MILAVHRAPSESPLKSSTWRAAAVGTALALSTASEGPPMPHNDAADVQALVRRLCRYLQDRPLASDTADGIAIWWLGLQRNAAEDEVGSALAWLVGAGVMETVEGLDGRVRYRRVRTGEADAMLHRLASAP
jgi:hypothetical protein